MGLLPIDFPAVHDTAVGSLAAALAAAGSRRSRHAVAADSGRAFELLFVEGTPRGAWLPAPCLPFLAEVAARAGVTMQRLRACDPGLSRALDVALAAGRAPIVARPLGLRGFGLAIGTLGERILVAGRGADGVACRLAAPSQLWDCPSDEDGIALVEEAGHAPAPAALLERACEALRGGATAGGARGLEALVRWESALESGDLDAEGHTELLALAEESRADAAAALTDLAESLPEEGPRGEAAIEIVHAANDLDAAAALYGGIGRDMLAERGDLARSDRRSGAASLVATARRRESSALARLEAARARLGATSRPRDSWSC